MLSFVRRLSKSTVGTVIMALFLLLIVASFAMADISGVLSGSFGGPKSGELAEVGGEGITDREMDEAMQRRLTEVRRVNPEATYADIAGDFDRILQALIDEKALQAFAREHGFNLSKRLVDAEIASIPAARDLSGKFSEQAYAQFLAQQRLSDAEIRQLISAGMLQQMLVAPVAVNARAPVGAARPYAAMLLERREGEVAFVPVAAFRSGLKPTPAQVQQYYAANQARYTVPQQRVLRIARIGPDQVGNVAASDAEIAAYYRQNQAQYADKESRTISQALVQDQAAAQAIATKVRGGQALSEAAGANAAVSTLQSQSREQYAGVAGEQAAAAVFGAADGAVVGPVRSQFGWLVARIEGVERQGGQSLNQARDEIAAAVTSNKRKEALTDLITRIEDELANGASFSEALKGTNVETIETPLITASGRSRDRPDFQLSPVLAPALGIGFELAEGDEPAVETLPEDAGYLLVAPARIVPAAPAPLAEIREQVAEDWVTAQATARAKAAAEAITQRAAKSSLEQAAQAASVDIPAVEAVDARRIQLSQFQGRVPPALGLLFSMGEGKVRMVPGAQGEGFYVVKVSKIEPGNASSQPSLIAETQQQLQEAMGQEYARQFMAAVRAEIGVERNEEAIAESKRRIASGAN